MSPARGPGPSRRTSPARRRADYDRRHGITPGMRRRATTISVIGSVALLVVMLLGLGFLAPRLGLQPSGGTQGSGTVHVDACSPVPLGMHACDATVTSWSGTSHTTGDPVSVVSRTVLSGPVAVVARDATGSVIDKHGYRLTTHAEWIMPADQGVLSDAARAGVVFATLAVWVVASWLLARLVLALTVRRAGREG